MTTFPGSPRLLKGGIVLIDPATGTVLRVIALQYNPVSLQRSLTARTVGEEGDRSQALRLLGPPEETYTLEAEIDAADQLEFPDQNAVVVEHTGRASVEQIVRALGQAGYGQVAVLA